jgi:hypothetical protein
MEGRKGHQEKKKIEGAKCGEVALEQEKLMDLGDYIEIYGDEGTLKADGYDDCIIGIDSHQRIVYNQEKIINKLEQDMPREEAIEFFFYNIEGANVGEYTPIYIHLFTLERYCNHEHKTYQAEERDTNVPESYTCDNCGKDFDIPEPDWDLMNKE